jgi:hypothetical protein
MHEERHNKPETDPAELVESKQPKREHAPELGESKQPKREHAPGQQHQQFNQPEHQGGISGGAQADMPDDGHKVRMQDAGPEEDNNP